MIVKVIKGKGFEGLASYNMKGDGRIMIGGNMAGRTPRELSKEVGQLRKLRPSLDRAVAHLMLSAAPEDPYLDSDTWREIAETFLKDLGLQVCPHVIFRHSDTDHQHIHIACLRIGPDGKTVTETNDRYKAERSAARIEKQFGLRQVNLKKRLMKEVKKPEAVVHDVSTHESIFINPKEKGMQSNESSESPSALAVDMQEPLNVGADLGGHAYALTHGATIMTAYVGDSPTERQRRNIKRHVMETGYDKAVRDLLDPDVSSIYHHPRGSVIYLKRPERINDEGDQLTAYHMAHERAAKAVIALACARGWTSIVFTGPHDFVVAAMREAIAQGMPVHPRDPGQRRILEQIIGEGSGAIGTVSIPMAFVPPDPSIPEHEDSQQPAPEVPAVPFPQLNTNLATKLALRRQQRASSDESHDNDLTNPKGPKRP